MRAARRAFACWLTAAAGCAAAGGVSAETAPALASWEAYTDLRSYYHREPEPLLRDGLEVTEVRLRAGVRYNRILDANWLFDGDVRAVARYRRREPGGTDRDLFVELKRLYLRGERLLGSRFLWAEVGRKRLQEPGSWLYDDDMDVAQLGYDSTLLDWRAGIAGWVTDARVGSDSSWRGADEPLEAVGSRYLFGGAEYQWYYRHFVGLDLVREDYERGGRVGPAAHVTDPDDLTDTAELTWLRLRARGERALGDHELAYVANLGTVTGSHRFLTLDQRGMPAAEVDQDLDGGLGWDLRLIGRFDHNRYAAGVGYAGGTGDGADDGDAAAYRQPQVASNKDSILGVERYRYYGEVLGPRLTNLEVFSLWGGLALTNSVWAEAAFHSYRQDEPQPWLFSDRGVFLPDGESRDIGRALDLVVGGRLRDDLDVMVVAGGFFGGEAFEDVSDDPDGYRLTLDVNLRW